MLIRRFAPADAAACHAVFVRAVQVGAAARYTVAERAIWLPDPTMPPTWGDWLNRHITFVAQDTDAIAGFMMLESDGYLNMAYVAPDHMGKGTADALYAAILQEARTQGIRHLRVLASRYAEGFFRRRGWTRLVEDRANLPHPPMNCQMVLAL